MFLRNNWPNALLMIFISSPPRNKSSIFHGLCHNHHCQRQVIILKVQHTKVHFIFFSVTDFKSSKLRFQLMQNPQCGRRCVFFSHILKKNSITYFTRYTIHFKSCVTWKVCVFVFIIINNTNVWLLYLKQSGHLVFCNC